MRNGWILGGLGASGWFLKMNKESGDFLASQFLKTAKELWADS